MGAGIRTECMKCYTKLNNVGTCPKCGWCYGKEVGQQTLFRESKETEGEPKNE